MNGINKVNQLQRHVARLVVNHGMRPAGMRTMHGHRAARRARAASQAETTSSTDATRRRQDLQMKQLPELLRETADIVLSTGPRGIMRGLQAAQVAGGLLREYVTAGRVDPPQVRAVKVTRRIQGSGLGEQPWRRMIHLAE